jgi:acetyltransferase
MSRRIPTYETPGKAVRGFMHLVRYRQNQDALMETPPSVPHEFRPDVATARRFIGEALAQRRDWLSEPEAKGVLAAYGIPVSRTLIAATPEEAGQLARAIGGPVAIKILSPDITHKSDVGGVVLDLETPDEVRSAALAMLARVSRAAPRAKLTGFTVQEMVRRPGAYELILGIADDRQFGPVILFGHGGTATEVIADTATALPPLNMNLARELIGRTRIVRLLQGFRDRKPADLDAVALTLIQLAQLAADLDEVAELDINPLLADPQGVVALDARIKVRVPAGARGSARLAIRPYPQEREDWVEVGRLGKGKLRPIRPEDELHLIAAFAKLDPEDIRMRFFAPMKTLPHDMAARLTQIDYDREMALLLERPETVGDIIGIVRLAADPDGTRAEFAIIVRSDVKGNGIGAMLMKRIIAYARTRKIGAIFGDVLQENTRMLALCRELGFTIEDIHVEAGIVRATLEL